MNHPDYEAILKWYRGKALVAVRDEAIPLLRRSVELGWWVPKASRRVRSILRKTHRIQCSTAASEANKLNGPGPIQGWHVLHGLIDLAPAHLSAIRALMGNSEPTEPTSHLQWATDFTPIAELLVELDEQRPKPAYVIGAISPTVMGNVGQAMGLSLETVRAPEIEWELKEFDIKGAKVQMWVGRVLWPDGTVHNASRFAYGSKAGNDQCEACGHAIKSGLFVPLLADSGGVPHALWTGRDCAKNLFGVVITGEAKFQR